MRASAAVSLVSFVAAATAATPYKGVPDQDITIKVGAGSSLEGHQLVGFVDGDAAFPTFVTAAEANESPSVFYMFYKDYSVFGWYSLNIDVANATYGLDIEAKADEGLIKLIDSDTYGTNIWRATNDTSILQWNGDSREFPFACTIDDGHIRLGVFIPGEELETCEQVQLEWKGAA